jgi:ATP-binding cassette subfamily B multidrug efflux pump
MFRFFESGIDPFRDHDETMPPASLFGFYWHYCRQVWPFLRY